MAPSSTDDGRTLTEGPDPYALLILNQEENVRPYDPAREAIGAEPVRFGPLVARAFTAAGRRVRRFEGHEKSVTSVMVLAALGVS